ncbi:MAG TPA: L-histidine N(alpha)-methyltransferase [Verrucomicrobiae bacterium]|nr:L-histidine N(alpha)-methyltransferase [Verrucomicrobiae bacterium]
MWVHPSCFPAQVAEQLRQGLRHRLVDPKFHYATYAQARSWRRVHEQYAPSHQDAATKDFYEQAYRAVLPGLREHEFQLLGLGCGLGQKEARFLEIVTPVAEAVSYLPVDMSVPLVIDAYLAGHPWSESSRPIVCDLSNTCDLPEVIATTSLHDCQRVATLFGVLPQLDPVAIFTSLQALLRPQDQVLCSVNLVPPGAPRQRLEAILAQYDNSLTNEWLLLFLRDLGIEAEAGHIEWVIDEVAAQEAYRLVAWFHFDREVQLEAAGETFHFRFGEKLQLFFSHRYTPEGLTNILSQLRAGRTDRQNGFGAPLLLENSWRTASGEEGLYHLRSHA